MSAAKLARMGRPKKSEPTEAVRMPRSVARKLRRLALHAEMDPGDYLAKEFGDGIDRRYAKMVEEMGKEVGGDDDEK